MDKEKILIPVRLSVVGQTKLKKIMAEDSMDLALTLFSDAVFGNRYRSFLYAPPFHISPHGIRYTTPVLPPGQTRKTHLVIRRDTLRSLRRLTRIGFSVSWIAEEALYFYCQSQSGAA